MAVGKNVMWGKGKQYHLFYNVKAVGKNIKWEKEEGDGNFGEENQYFKKWGGEEFKVVGNFIHP